jgi:hypothetical protein
MVNIVALSSTRNINFGQFFKFVIFGLLSDLIISKFSNSQIPASLTLYL